MTCDLTHGLPSEGCEEDSRKFRPGERRFFSPGKPFRLTLSLTLIIVKYYKAVTSADCNEEIISS